MLTFDAWDIVKVPFPYTDRPVRQRRPALVIAAEALFVETGLLWVVMITSTENRGWPGDVEVTNLVESGLPAPSKIRTAKIACIDGGDAGHLGSVTDDTLRKMVAEAIKGRLGIVLAAS